MVNVFVRIPLYTGGQKLWYWFQPLLLFRILLNSFEIIPRLRLLDWVICVADDKLI